MKLTVFITTICLMPVLASAQSIVKLTGTVTDGETGNPLYGVHVMIRGTGFGASTNQLGTYRIENLLAGEYTVTASHIGYETFETTAVRIAKDQPVRLDMALASRAIPVGGVTITARRENREKSTDLWIIDSETVARSGARHVGELIEQVPGVDVEDTGGTGGAKKISIRGSQTNQVLILLDGVPLNDELKGDADLSAIPVHLIEKIEIHKGAGSHRFGSGAVGGAVNIITKKTFQNRFRIDGSAGSFGLTTLEPSVSGRYKNIGYFISGHYLKSNGDFAYGTGNGSGQEKRLNAGAENLSLFGKLQLPCRMHHIALKMHHQVSERGIPGTTVDLSPFAETDSRQTLLGLDYTWDNPESDLTFSADISWSDAKTENTNLYDPAEVELIYRAIAPYHYRYGTRNALINVRGEYDPAAWYQMTAGYTRRLLKYEDESIMENAAASRSKAEDTVHGFFLHQEINLRFPKQRLRLTASPALRFDEMRLHAPDQDRTIRQWSPAIGFSAMVGEKNQCYIRSRFARSFRAPTFADLFYQDVRVEGKPDLLPENGRHAGVTVGGKLTAWVSLRAEVGYFHDIIDNLIIWRLGSFEVFRPFNNDAEISGHEVLLTLNTPGDVVILDLGYTRLDPLNKNKDETLYDRIIPFRSRNTFKAGLDIRLKRLRLSAGYRDVGKRYVNEANTKSLPRYRVWDADIHWTLPVGPLKTIWRFSVINLTDERYQIVRDMPMPPREWRAGISLII